MPLKAIVDGRTVTGPDLSADEWADLAVRHRNGLAVTMACCGAPGHLRVSGKGTRHFYHAADAGCRYAEESREHLEIKGQVYRICRSEGWETAVEFPAPDRTWIADVYAAKDGRKIVFEIQISAISPGELADRDAKYRDGGIESYWLLDRFLGRSKDFLAWYDAYLSDGRPGETVPSIDPSLFATGPENHIFIPKGIRSVGLHAEEQTLFTTNNPKIPLAVWVREVLKGNYLTYLEETAAAVNRKRRLMGMAAPDLIRSQELYDAVIRRGTFRKKAGRAGQIARAGAAHGKAVQKKSRELLAEIDWLEKEYRSFMADSSGLFTWKKIPGHDTARPFFRLESESKVRKLRECMEMFDRWEMAFADAIQNLERGFPSRKKVQ